MAKAKLLLQIAVFLFVSAESQSRNTSRLQEITDFGNKCGNCPCDRPCNPYPPPPPSPPPPSPLPLSPPPPIAKPPPSKACPPPPETQWHAPSPPYVYTTGPPGSIYQVYPFVSGARGRRSRSVSAVVLMGIGGWAVMGI
ncbi:hypothetical protein M569_12382 [Genlisea aurea]|uniref:Uncharacterized protein n=1 Tax=Genlisea aurea TaxID=192259 RepID=S8DI48_9LAMI|nr:hypothetical protein M569_12382 [Genlisea aurea]